MHINVLIEPDHRHSAWDQLVLAGISAEARRRKYAVTVLDQTVLSCAEGSDPLVIVVGSDVAWLQQALQSAAKAGYRAIVISPASSREEKASSSSQKAAVSSGITPLTAATFAERS